MKGENAVTDTDDEDIDLRLLRMGPSGNKGYVIEITGRTVAAIAGHLAAWLRAHEAENYTETEFTHYETPFTVTVQRNNGQTPHQLRRKAEAERDELLSILEAVDSEISLDGQLQELVSDALTRHRQPST